MTDTIKTESRNLSDFWRIRKSYDQAVEMRSLLYDLKSLIELAADEGDFNVSWSGKQHDSYSISAEKKIQLSYLPLRDIDTPYAGSNIDAVVGYAAHEAGHYVRRNQEPRRLSPAERPEGMTESIEGCIRNTLEDVFIDHYLYQYTPVLKSYIKAGREYDKTTPQYQSHLLDLQLKPPEEVSKLDILALWIYYELYGVNKLEDLQDLPINAVKTLVKLAKITDDYCQRRGLIAAAEIYQTIWDELKTYPGPGEVAKQQQQKYGQREDEDDKDGDDGENAGRGISFKDDNESDEEDKRSSGGSSSSVTNDGKDDKKDSDESSEAQDDNDDNKDDTDKSQESEESKSQEESKSDDSKEPDDESSNQNSGTSDNEKDDDNGDDEDGSGSNNSVDDTPKTKTDDELYDSLLPCTNEEYKEIPPEILDELRRAIEYEREDITQDVKEVLETNSRHSMPDAIVLEKAISKLLIPARDEITQNVNRIFEYRKRRQTRWSRGTEEGSLSQSRLYRASYNSSHIYEKREVKDTLDLGICILVDASQSVKTNWPTIELVMNSLAVGLSNKKGVKVCALAYQQTERIRDNVKDGLYIRNRHRQLNLYRLFESGAASMGSCEPDGSTPSVTSFIAVPDVMRRLLGKTRDKLLIHITDGFATDEANNTLNPDGLKMGDAVKILESKGIEVYCIAVGLGVNYSLSSYNTAQNNRLEAAYKNSYTCIASYKELPEALKDLLVNKLAV